MVKVNKAECISCGNCTQICGEVFKMGDDNKSEVIEGQENSTAPCVDKAIEECPAHCISK